MTLRIAKIGSWLYAESAAQVVDIVALDYDFWYRLGEADGTLEQGEVPQQFGPNGFLYYVRFRHALETSEPTWPDSPGYASIAEAVAHAESKIAGKISWRDTTVNGAPKD